MSLELFLSHPEFVLIHDPIMAIHRVSLVARDPPGPKSEIPIDAYCVVCGFKLDWKVVLGGRQLEREAREQKRGLYRLSTEGS